MDNSKYNWNINKDIEDHSFDEYIKNSSLNRNLLRYRNDLPWNMKNSRKRLNLIKLKSVTKIQNQGCLNPVSLILFYPKFISKPTDWQ